VGAVSIKAYQMEPLVHMYVRTYVPYHMVPCGTGTYYVVCMVIQRRTRVPNTCTTIRYMVCMVIQRRTTWYQWYVRYGQTVPVPVVLQYQWYTCTMVLVLVPWYVYQWYHWYTCTMRYTCTTGTRVPYVHVYVHVYVLVMLCHVHVYVRTYVRMYHGTRVWQYHGAYQWYCTYVPWYVHVYVLPW
jgi:hypothetical protein